MLFQFQGGRRRWRLGGRVSGLGTGAGIGQCTFLVFRQHAQVFQRVEHHEALPAAHPRLGRGELAGGDAE
ncbi:MAG: hypothetical protein D6717_03935 [Gammaproteobacteria bacterium]|nr:MAG: hypothetical protein D6717_03935 [Gammaproteobacteria bacterium]